MDPSKNGDFSYFGGNYKGQHQMPYGYANAGYDPASVNASYMGQAMGYGGADMGENASFMNMVPPNDQNSNYYQEYCRLFIANVVLTTQMKEIIAEKNELLLKLSELERGEKPTKEPTSATDFGTDKKARIRRKAADVERHFKCHVETCQKTYGSEGSLLQHVKLKHPEACDDPDWKMKLLQKNEHSEGGDKE